MRQPLPALHLLGCEAGVPDARQLWGRGVPFCSAKAVVFEAVYLSSGLYLRVPRFGGPCGVAAPLEACEVTAVGGAVLLRGVPHLAAVSAHHAAANTLRLFADIWSRCPDHGDHQFSRLRRGAQVSGLPADDLLQAARPPHHAGHRRDEAHRGAADVHRDADLEHLGGLIRRPFQRFAQPGQGGGLVHLLLPGDRDPGRR
mmetsp:Transcript_59288/g.154030  ORF Transcript_59288/g.154030 Transcript_59288/m.154030 type:complete len:200 (+) Transcript_59288:652-1251(+)